MSFSHIAQSTRPKLVLPEERTTGLGCIPERKNISYQCKVNDTTNRLTGSTIWSGSAFHCPLHSNQINLLHSQFSEMRSVLCGTLMARLVREDGSCYESQLSLTATTELNGTTISCSFGPLNESDSIVVGG